MCIGFPGKVIEIKNNQAKVEQQDHSHWVDISTLKSKVEVGDYLLTYLDAAINKVSKEEAKEIFELMNGTSDARVKGTN